MLAKYFWKSNFLTNPDEFTVSYLNCEIVTFKSCQFDGGYVAVLRNLVAKAL